jgi:hypothetical protein
MGGRASNLYMFEGTLKTHKEIMAVYTAVSKETLRRALLDGCNSIADVNAWLSTRKSAQLRGAKNGSDATIKNRSML